MALKRDAGFLKVVFHQVRVRPRLATATVLGLLTYFFCGGDDRAQRALVA